MFIIFSFIEIGYFSPENDKRYNLGKEVMIKWLHLCFDSLLKSGKVALQHACFVDSQRPLLAPYLP